MKILIADDDPKIRNILQSLLTRYEYDVLVANDGIQAWQILSAADFPLVALLDWIMPGMDGIALCRKVREKKPLPPRYILLLTGKEKEEDVIEGLRAGADDYIIKPFSNDILLARIQTGIRIILMQLSLEKHIKELEEALAHVKKLEGLLPICSYCKRIHDGRNDWHPIELYISEHLQAEFTHIICPECQENIVRPELEQLKFQKGVKQIRRSKAPTPKE